MLFTRSLFPACNPRMQRGSLRLYLGLRTPQSPMTHAKAGTVPAHLTGNYAFDINRTSSGEPHSPQATSCRTANVHPFLRSSPASSPRR
jgi:hypothetical protein